MATCGACQGSKTQSCPKCMGRGYVSRLTSSGDIDTKPCWVCGGRREIRCQLCKGTGEVESIPGHEHAVLQPDLSGFKPARSFRRSSTDRIIAGVVGGLADYFLINSTIVRWVLVAVTILTLVLPCLVIYLVLWVFLPEAKSSHSASTGG